jgi:hypothetical protein
LLALAGVLILKLGRRTLELCRFLMLRNLFTVTLGCPQAGCLGGGPLGIVLALERPLFARTGASSTFALAGLLATVAALVHMA